MSLPGCHLLEMLLSLLDETFFLGDGTTLVVEAAALGSGHPGGGDVLGPVFVVIAFGVGEVIPGVGEEGGQLGEGLVL